VAVDTARAALSMSTATTRAALAVGVKIETRREHAPAVAVSVDTLRAALAVGVACSCHGCKNLNHIITIVKTDFRAFISIYTHGKSNSGPKKSIHTDLESTLKHIF